MMFWMQQNCLRYNGKKACNSGQISELPEDFYPKLRRFISDLKDQASKQSEKYQEYDRTKQLARDIVKF